METPEFIQSPLMKCKKVKWFPSQFYRIIGGVYGTGSLEMV